MPIYVAWQARGSRARRPTPHVLLAPMQWQGSHICASPGACFPHNQRSRHGTATVCCTQGLLLALMRTADENRPELTQNVD